MGFEERCRSMLQRIVYGIQSLAFLAISVSWFTFLLTGTQPSRFVVAVWVTLGALLTAGILQVVSWRFGGVPA